MKKPSVQNIKISDQGGGCVLHIEHESAFVKPVRVVGWLNGQDECQSKQFSMYPRVTEVVVADDVPQSS